ncbi:MAG: hypothetical protein JOZ85_11985 [Betaproteobacteria bacterium]|nr:hypothetical protein [Betaproteobacteria bacterium]
MVNITIEEDTTAKKVTINLDNDPIHLSGLGANSNLITWNLTDKNNTGWAFSSAGGINIKNPGSMFTSTQHGDTMHKWTRAGAGDFAQYGYTISLTKTANGVQVQTIVLDPTIVNEP